MKKNNIDYRLFYPSINKAKYLGISGNFPNSNLFEKNGIYLPTGPTQSISEIIKVIETLTKFDKVR